MMVRLWREQAADSTTPTASFRQQLARCTGSILHTNLCLTPVFSVLCYTQQEEHEFQTTLFAPRCEENRFAM